MGGGVERSVGGWVVIEARALFSRVVLSLALCWAVPFGAVSMALTAHAASASVCMSPLSAVNGMQLVLLRGKGERDGGWVRG